MADWYVKAADDEYGPAPFDQLQEWAREGRVRENTLVKEGYYGDWVVAQTIEGLLAEHLSDNVPAMSDTVAPQIRVHKTVQAARASDPRVERVKRRKEFPLVPVLVCSVTGLLVVFGVGLASVKWIQRDSINSYVQKNRERAAVRAYLREDLADPNYEVVKWGETFVVERDRRIWEEGVGPIGTMKKGWVGVPLKFRFTNPFGGKSITNRIFMVSGDSVVKVLQSEDWQRQLEFTKQVERAYPPD